MGSVSCKAGCDTYNRKVSEGWMLVSVMRSSVTRWREMTAPQNTPSTHSEELGKADPAWTDVFLEQIHDRTKRLPCPPTQSFNWEADNEVSCASKTTSVCFGACIRTAAALALVKEP